jgi:hypothetical protein
VRAALEPYIIYRELFDTVKMFYDKERKAEKSSSGMAVASRNAKSMEDMLYQEMVF